MASITIRNLDDGLRSSGSLNIANFASTARTTTSRRFQKYFELADIGAP